MVTNNKVLTVSYGTFSCTLEGFEDSFDTMKAIAEYFRDLASDDRYFGAEPPTPDAEMLARIAEREIERRVSARMDQGAIVLSAADRVKPVEEPAEKAAQAKAEDAKVDEAAQQQTVEADVSETAPVAEPVVESAAAEAEIEEPAKDDAPLKSAGIAAAAAAAAAVIAADNAEAEIAEEDVSETPAEEILEDVAEAPLEGADSAETADNIEEAAEADLDAIADAVAEDFDADEETGEETVSADTREAVAEEADVEDVASEDFDITNLLAETEEDENVSIDEAIDTIAAEDVLVLQDSIQAALAEDTFDTDDAAEAEAIDAAEIEVLDPVAEDADDLADDWDDEEPASDYAENSIAAKLERIRAVVARGNSEADEDGFSEDEHARDLDVSANDDEQLMDVAQDAASAAAMLDDQDDALTEDVFAPEMADEDDVLSDVKDDQAEEDAEKPVLRARVVRMKKADFEEAVASGLLEAEAVDEDEDEIEDADFAEVEAPVVQATSDSSLTPEDEADLMAELAQVEAELKGEVAARAEPAAEIAQEEAGVEDAQLDEASVDAMFDDSDYEDDEEEQIAGLSVAEEDQATSGDAAHGEPDLSRLMAKANSEMEEPEGSRRRRAIAHLRAAVAATRAEKAAGNGAVNKDDTVAYRDDLASVVRAVPGGKSDQKADVTPTKRKPVAPLKLVAEQRVDPTPEAAPAAEAAAPAAEQNKAPKRVPVRPRRVSTDRKDREEIARTVAPVGSVASVQGGFADYAQSVGAATMPQILEAAAAYVTFVKGQERFSRPMLMRMARDANEAEFSREEGLRSFGQLLRDQKIRKIAGGRFTADESINFKPEDRAVG